MKKPSPYLTFAGAIPFVVCAIFITVDIDAIRVLGKTEYVLSIYGLVIASFIKKRRKTTPLLGRGYQASAIVV